MLEVDEDAQRLPHDVVRAASLHMHDEADAAGIVFGGRIVQTLTLRCASWVSGGKHEKDCYTIAALIS